MLHWYHTHGLIIENISAFIQYNPVRCFQQFMEEVADEQRAADANTLGNAAGNMVKLIFGTAIFKKYNK